MIDIDIPGFGHLQLTDLVTDYNGTLAVDGRLLPGIGAGLIALAGHLRIHVVTADTFGIAAGQLARLPVQLNILPAAGQADAKRDFVAKLGADNVVAIGNGRNDRKMLAAAALGIALIQGEGAAAETLAAADVVATDIVTALGVLNHPKRLVATLRS